MDGSSTWKQTRMKYTRAGHCLVGYKEGFFVLGGWYMNGARRDTEWANVGGSFSVVGENYGRERYRDSCCVADEDAGFIYQISGWCDT